MNIQDTPKYVSTGNRAMRFQVKSAISMKQDSSEMVWGFVTTNSVEDCTVNSNTIQKLPKG